MIWKCFNCHSERENVPDGFCPDCGLIQMSKWTEQKYKILEDYCHPLCLIMRKQGFEHYCIDACAGSGAVQKWGENGIRDGSPLIMAKTREWVENTIIDKTKQPTVQCKFIEFNPNTFRRLRESTAPYDDFVECIHGDCNKELDKILDEIPNAFTFVYIDPFGLGTPVIQRETIERVLKRKFTELFIHFSWEGVSRVAGEIKNIDHPVESIRKLARSHIETLNSHIGLEWQEIWKKTSLPYYRRKLILESYISKLKEYYDKITWVAIPVGSTNPNYYLIFTTRNLTGAKIMGGIIDKLRRKGTVPLDKFSSKTTIYYKLLYL